MMHPDQHYTVRMLQHADLAHEAAAHQHALLFHATAGANPGWRARMWHWLINRMRVLSTSGIRRVEL